MKNKSVLILINIFSVIIQTSFLQEFFGNKINPNLVAIIVFAMLLKGSITSAYLSAIVGGLFLDLVSGGIVGLSAFLFTLFVWLYSQLHSFYLRNMFARLFFATTCFYFFKLLITRSLVFDGWLIVGSLFTAALGQLFSLFLEQSSDRLQQ